MLEITSASKQGLMLYPDYLAITFLVIILYLTFLHFSPLLIFYLCIRTCVIYIYVGFYELTGGALHSCSKSFVVNL